MNNGERPKDTKYEHSLIPKSEFEQAQGIHTISSSELPPSQPIHQFNSQFMNISNNNNTNYRQIPFNYDSASTNNNNLDQYILHLQQLQKKRHEEQQQQQQQQNIQTSLIQSSQNHQIINQLMAEQVQQGMYHQQQNEAPSQNVQYYKQLLAEQKAQHEKKEQKLQMQMQMQKMQMQQFFQPQMQQFNPWSMYQFNPFNGAYPSQQISTNRTLPLGPTTTQEAKLGSHRPHAEHHHAMVVKVAEKKGMILKIKKDGSNCPSITHGLNCPDQTHASKHFWCFKCHKAFKWGGNSNITGHILTKTHFAYAQNHIMLRFFLFFVDRQQLLLLIFYRPLALKLMDPDKTKNKNKLTKKLKQPKPQLKLPRINLKKNSKLNQFLESSADEDMDQLFDNEYSDMDQSSNFSHSDRDSDFDSVMSSIHGNQGDAERISRMESIEEQEQSKPQSPLSKYQQNDDNTEEGKKRYEGQVPSQYGRPISNERKAMISKLIIYSLYLLIFFF